MLHTISLRRTDTDTQIPCSEWSLSASSDAWAETFTATCHGPAARALLDAPRPTELELSVDGLAWRLVLDRSTLRQGAVGQNSVQIAARSLSWLLGAPNAEPRDYLETAARMASQLADQELPDDWEINWSAPDWLVPAGVWSYQAQTPVQAIARLAAAIGARIVPARSQRLLTVAPRYPVLPWDYASASPNAIIPPGAYWSSERQDPPPEQANAVYLVGGAVGGLVARCVRIGTDGALLASPPQVQDDLLTHADAARARAGAVLGAAAATGGLSDIEIPLDGGADWPLFALGDLVEVQAATAPAVRATVLGRTLTGRATGRAETLVQRLQFGAGSLERWRHATAPGTPLYIAVAVADHGDGTATVEYPTGARGRVRGSAAAGAAVWVRAGRIEGLAPALGAVDLEV